MKQQPAQPLEDLPDLTPLRAAVLSGYYGLLSEGRVGEFIGAREVIAWIERHFPDALTPSDSLAQKVLQEHRRPHRSPGRPRTESILTRDTDASPLCPVRSKPPKVREPK